MDYCKIIFNSLFLSNERQTSIPLSIEALDPGFTFNENVSSMETFFMTLWRGLMTLTKSKTLYTMMIFMSVSVTDDDDDDDKEYND